MHKIVTIYDMLVSSAFCAPSLNFTVGTDRRELFCSLIDEEIEPQRNLETFSRSQS